MLKWLWDSLGFGNAEQESETEHHDDNNGRFKGERGEIYYGEFGCEHTRRFNASHDHRAGQESSQSRANVLSLDDRFGALGISMGQESAHVGSKFNQWQRPESEYGKSDPSWVQGLKDSDCVGEMDISRQEWARAQEIVEEVLVKLLDEMKVRARAQFQGLRIDKYVRQGSSRDGLKVIAPDEFDTGFEFWIEGISFKECPIIKDGKRVPGFCYIKVNQTKTKLERNCPELLKKEVFQEWTNGGMYLSSKKLHRHVFQSLMDQSLQTVASGYSGVTFTRKMNPPAINITIHLNDDAYKGFAPRGMLKQYVVTTKDIDVDIIPALRLQIDQYSAYNDEKMNATIHVICKWKEEESEKALEIADQNFVWLINSVAYERHIFDVARGDSKQQYITTALRLVKTYLTKVKAICKRNNSTPPPITILKSYHLKQITCYVILYSCYLYPSTPINSAQQALVYLLSFLHVCLDQAKLPHFFYSNPQIEGMFHNYPFRLSTVDLRYDLFRKVKRDSLLQAKMSLKRHMATALRVNISNGDSDILSANFLKNISDGEYF
ncbi:hypothetical protein ACF0H5_003712 [Mactra antiquata]